MGRRRIRARDEWIDRARAERIETVLRERGILKKLTGRGGNFAGSCPVCGGRGIASR